MLPGMEKLIRDIEAYALASGKTPQMVLRASIKAGWGAWASWKSGQSSPTMAVADRIYAWIEANPAPTPNQEDAA